MDENKEIVEENEVVEDEVVEAEVSQGEEVVEAEVSQGEEVVAAEVSGNSENSENKEEGFNLKKEVISWIKVCLSAVIIAWVVSNFIIMNAYIPSASMENTLTEGDRLIGFRLAYLFDEPERFDVVMFKFPDDESKDYIKRVIGLPGETVTIKEGKVYINDSTEPLDEPYLKAEPLAIGDGVYEVPENCYFMLGDNRNSSKDSRLWNNKYVQKDKILAKALFRFYPDITWIKTDY